MTVFGLWIRPELPSGKLSTKNKRQMFIFSWIIEVLFFAVCGWLGHAFVKVITLGKVDLDYGDSSEGVITEFIGVGVILMLAGCVSAAISHTTH